VEHKVRYNTYDPTLAAKQSMCIYHLSEDSMNIAIEPLLALVVGILILLVPRFLNYFVAVYLIVVGVLGLMGHSIK